MLGRIDMTLLGSIGFLAFLVLHVWGAVFEPQIPSVASFTPSSGTFKLSPSVRIVVDNKYAKLGSPSLLEYASTFRAELEDTLPYAALAPIELSSVVPDSLPAIPTIFLTLESSLEYKLYNGQSTDEGYDFQVSPNVYIIKGSAPLGVWWGSRTFLQQAAIQLGRGARTVSFPAGKGSDSPGWEVRGFMLDAGRHWFDTSFLGQCLCLATF